MARGLGFVTRRIEHPDQVHQAWVQAFNANRPCLLEFVTDPAGKERG